jgi:hypothetical protein
VGFFGAFTAEPLNNVNYLVVIGNQDLGSTVPVSSRHRKKVILIIEFQDIAGEQFAISPDFNKESIG